MPWHGPEPWNCHPFAACRLLAADRRAGDVLWSGGLVDTGALLNQPFTSTVGYWPTSDPYPERDVDHVRVTRDLAAAVRAVRVHRTELALAASDHLPKVAELDLAALTPA